MFKSPLYLQVSSIRSVAYSENRVEKKPRSEITGDASRKKIKHFRCPRSRSVSLHHSASGKLDSRGSQWALPHTPEAGWKYLEVLSGYLND